VQIILLSQNFKLFFHSNNQLIFQLHKLDLKLTPLFLMFLTKTVAKLVCVLSHQPIYSHLLRDLELVELFSKI